MSKIYKLSMSFMRDLVHGFAFLIFVPIGFGLIGITLLIMLPVWVSHGLETIYQYGGKQ